jgi:RND family efflux transporter MFP subunit
MKRLFSVMPAKAGIQYLQTVANYLDSGFRRSNGFFLTCHLWRKKIFSRPGGPAALAGAVMVLILAASGLAQEQPKGPPPPLVAVAEVKAGKVSPQAEFIGTVYYVEVSDVAAEVAGIVEAVKIEDGQRVKAGQPLVELRTDLLAKRLEATRSSHQQVLAELEVAKIEFSRKEKLFEKGSISEQSYDDNRFRARALERRANSLNAEVERIELEIRKAVIRAPFDGVVIKRSVDRGEWLAEGKTVAVLARDDVIDIMVEVPESYIRQVRSAGKVRVRIGGTDLEGSITALIPRGDVATRNFPVKVRAANSQGFIEGMSATVWLPTAKTQTALIVSRDALISNSGRTVVFVLEGSKVRALPVAVIAYEGPDVGIAAEGLQEGMKVVVKGNERLRDGQEVVLNR